jgi:hypothetical protein
VTLEETPVDSAVWRALEGGEVPGFVTLERHRGHHHVLELPSTYEEYMARFSSKTRSTLGRKARRLASEAGGLELRLFSGPADMEPLLTTIEHVVKKTYQYRLLGKDLTGANRSLLRSLTRWAERGWVRGYVLLADNRAIAYVVGYLVFYCGFRKLWPRNSGNPGQLS